MEGKYELRCQRIVILGNGKIAVDCLYELLNYVDKTNIFVIESQYSPVSLLKKNCDKNNVRYFPANEVITTLSQAIVPKTLVISANNSVIIPSEICESNTVEIINFHYSFLPDYKGVNIPSWVIFNREESTGVTWHYVNAELDAGEIICQKKIILDETSVALQIVQKGMELGIQCFKEMMPQFLNERISGIKNGKGEHFYKSSQFPHNAEICETDDGELISRMLRTYDYGVLALMGVLRFRFGGKMYGIKNYAIYKDGGFIAGKQLHTYQCELNKGVYKIQLVLEDI